MRLQNRSDLWEAVKTSWYAIPLSICHKLVNSMPKRLIEVKKNKGHAIHTILGNTYNIRTYNIRQFL